MLEKLVTLYYKIQHATIDKVKILDGLAPLALRLYLVPVFWMSGTTKWDPFDSSSSLQNTIDWFGNADWGLGLPFPDLLAYLAWGAEYFGAILLLIGLATRWISIPLIITMIVAIFTVHIDNGWNAIGSSMHNPEIASRIDAARNLLQEYGNYDWLTEEGPIVILQNGIEFAVTYIIMLFVLFFSGGGRFFSVDYYLNNYFSRKYGLAVNASETDSAI